MEKKKPLITILLSLLLLSVALGYTIGQREAATQTSVNEDDFLVGASYMTFLGTKIDIDWNSTEPYIPTLGKYSSNDTTIVDQHIEWAIGSGIDFFFLDYGWATGNRSEKIENAAIEGLLEAESMKNGDFKFCIFYFPDRVVDSGFVNKSRLEDDFRHINKTYFSRSGYLCLDDRFVVVLADFPEYLDKTNSTEEINSLFWDLEVNSNFSRSLYLIPAFWPCPTYQVYGVLSDKRKIYDAITLWGQNTILEFNESITYSAYVNKTKLNLVMWSGIAYNFDVAFVPLICPGYNNTKYFNMGIRNYTAIVTRDLKGFREVCALGREYSSSPYNIVLLFTWNDFNEATSIEPTTDYQYTYLNITALEFLLVVAFGARPGDSSWNQEADLNNDYAVDIFDIVLLANNFGKTA